MYQKKITDELKEDGKVVNFTAWAEEGRDPRGLWLFYHKAYSSFCSRQHPNNKITQTHTQTEPLCHNLSQTM